MQWPAAITWCLHRWRELISGPSALGPRGERIAEKFLRRSRYRILARNARTPIGEADLVCEDPDGRTVVFVEVKTRMLGARPAGMDIDGTDAARRGPPPEASVGARKRRKLLAVARDLSRRKGWDRRPLRIDIVAIEIPREGPPVIRHHCGAVRR